MKTQLQAILKAEFTRYFTLSKIIILSLVTILGVVIAMLPSWLGFFDSEAAGFFAIKDIFTYALKIIIPFSIFFITPGIIANDVNNFWFRTVFSRPVQRQTVLASKYIYASLLLLLFTIAFCLIPLIVFSFTAPGIEFNVFSVLSIWFFAYMEGLLFISIAIWFSCFLSKFFNVLLLAIWMFADNIVINGVLANFFWDSPIMGVFTEFFFPNGFANAASFYSLKDSFPVEHFFWGMAALTFFGALSYLHFSLINIDRPGND
ncbi:MAG: hypothetical protein CVV22_00580 [Ignavibacteriae bacterium HGW-Ignavibacteriae-1]|jgi:ABC-type transport system involved in multi-copper enzyme maturation permease subunit|nr:MAG: hypothetical protein CVV22_00580 [Ignavibacteriae bacterium HGW-Ignavibacteriae-1]